MPAKGIIAAGHPLTARAAEEILREGGNACDAALAAVLAACVAEPVLASPGGGGFLLAAPAQAPIRAYDFFVQTPGAPRPEADLDFYPIQADFGTVLQEFHIGRGTVAVPGFVAGMFAVHRDLASMPMRDIAAPALAYARDGIAITDYQARLFQVVKATFLATPAVRQIFSSAVRAGDLVGAGETLRQPELADALEAIAIEGEALFYRGEIAAAIVEQMHPGGQLRADDLENYRVAIRAPLAIDYRDARISMNPPPASGGVLIGFGLELLKASDVAQTGFGSAAHLDLLAGVMAATQQARVDMKSMPGGAADTALALLDPVLVARYRGEIAGRPRAQRGTTQISIIDGKRNIVSLTVSNGEGSGCVVPGTGIVLNNMLGEEDLNPDGFHRLEANQRMSSMMTPAVVRWPDGRAVAAGSGGSNRIRTAMLQLLVNLVDFEMDIESAVESPRIHYEQGKLSIEGGLDAERLRDLLDRYPDHHLWDSLSMFFGGAHSVMSSAEGFSGAGDPRRGGISVRC